MVSDWNRLTPIMGVKVDRAAIRSEPTSERGHIEMQAGQEKAGASPHTLQERRPRDNKETQRNSQTDEVQQIEQQRESLSGENRKTGIGEVVGWQRMSEPTPEETGNQVPDHFFVTPYGSEGCQEERVSSTPRGHPERTF